MKIQRVAIECRPKVYALLQRAFSGSAYEETLVRRLHEGNKLLQEWVCIHTNKVIAYLGFSNAYHGKVVCGLHLAPMVVAPDFQKQGVGSELLRFALRQESIKSQSLFVLGEPRFYQRFGFEPCSQPVCPFDQNNAHFMSLRHDGSTAFVVGYESEFKGLASQAAARFLSKRKARR